MKLTTNLSGPLIELLRTQAAPIDGIEVGPWITPRNIAANRKLFPDLPFYFHGGNIINGIPLLPGAGRNVADYLAATGSPWVSLHITFQFPGVKRFFWKRNWHIPSRNPERATREFIQKVRTLSGNVKVPVLMENPDPLPLYDNHETQTDRIIEILDATESRLLLDIGHARLAAEVEGISAEEYILRLPMDRLDQVHVSGPRLSEGRLFDAHEPMQEIDYRLLEFVLAHSKPKVVTLEYIRRIDPLREQLSRLRGIMDGNNS